MTDQKPPVERVHPPDWLMRAVNPFMKKVIARGRRSVGEHLLLLHYTGRKTGRPYTLPCGYRRIDGRIALLTNSKWRHNFAGGAGVHVTLGRRLLPARAELLADPDAVARIYEHLLDEIGWEKAGRQLGIRINAGRRPKRDELRDMIERSGLSVVWIDLESP